MIIGQMYFGKCIDYSHNGKGVIKIDGEVLFVDNLIIDEEATIMVQYKRAQVYYGKIVKLLTKSVYRVEEYCNVCGSCGGCQFGKLLYEKTLDFKSKRVEVLLSSIYNKKIPIIENHSKLGYRNKIIIQTKTFSNKKFFGFYKEGTHDIVDINECSLVKNEINTFMKFIKPLLINSNLSFYDESSNQGLIKALAVRFSDFTKELLVTLIVTKYSKEIFNDLFANIKKNKDKYRVSSLTVNINPQTNNILFGPRTIHIFGHGHIEEQINGYRFKLSTTSFFQVNTIDATVLFSEAIAMAKLSKNDIVIDAYCGVGTIAILASKYCQRIIGVDIVSSAIIDANMNKKDNNISNIDFVCQDINSYILNNKHFFDCVFVDPPRKGLDTTFIEVLLTILPKKIVYISCSPETLTRDLLLLSSHYEIIDVKLVDMFAYTYNIESIVALQRK